MIGNLIILIFIIIIAIISLSIPLKCPGIISDYKEGFIPYSYSNYYYPFYSKYCSSCGWKSRYSCSNCINCGYCITPYGYGECVPGDSKGPYFREDCLAWEYAPFPFYHRPFVYFVHPYMYYPYKYRYKY